MSVQILGPFGAGIGIFSMDFQSDWNIKISYFPQQYGL